LSIYYTKLYIAHFVNITYFDIIFTGSDIMKLFEIIIDNIKYDFIDSIKLNDKNYVAYKDSEDNVYISEYVVVNESINFLEVNEETINKVREAMAI